MTSKPFEIISRPVICKNADIIGSNARVIKGKIYNLKQVTTHDRVSYELLGKIGFIDESGDIYDINTVNSYTNNEPNFVYADIFEYLNRHNTGDFNSPIIANVQSKGFRNSTDTEIESFLHAQGFTACRKLDDGDWVGILKLATTWSVCNGINALAPFMYRWCFRDIDEAINFYNIVEEVDDVPEEGNRKSLVGHRWATKALLHMNDEKGFPKW